MFQQSEILKDFTAENLAEKIFDEEPAGISQFLAPSHLSTDEKGQFTFSFHRLLKIQPIAALVLKDLSSFHRPKEIIKHLIYLINEAALDSPNILPESRS